MGLWLKHSTNSVSHSWQGCLGIESLESYICSVDFIEIYLLEKENQKNKLNQLHRTNRNIQNFIIISWIMNNCLAFSIFKEKWQKCLGPSYFMIKIWFHFFFNIVFVIIYSWSSRKSINWAEMSTFWKFICFISV